MVRKRELAIDAPVRPTCTRNWLLKRTPPITSVAQITTNHHQSSKQIRRSGLAYLQETIPPHEYQCRCILYTAHITYRLRAVYNSIEWDRTSNNDLNIAWDQVDLQLFFSIDWLTDLSYPGKRTNKIRSLCVCFFCNVFFLIDFLFQSRKGGNGVNETNKINKDYVSSQSF